MEPQRSLTYEDIQACHDRLKEFFPKFLELAGQELRSYGVSQSVVVYYSYALQYNLQGGKMLRGAMVVSTVKALCGKDMSDHLWAQTLVAAWCVELLQTSFLVADDIMDQSTRRRSNMCWYLVPTIGVSNAINDVMFLYTLIHRILFKVFRDSTKLVEILATFNRVAMTTILGQHMDTYEANNDKLLQRPPEAAKLFEEISKNKTSYYTFFLPIKLGMLLGDMGATNLFYSRVESICVMLGTMFQAQDDYLDAYGDPVKFGKVGTDIQTRKCSWLLTQALALATDRQKKLIAENIGVKDPARVAVVKGVYDELQLDRVFLKYSEYLQKQIEEKIEEIEHQGVKNVLKWCIGLIKNRSK